MLEFGNSISNGLLMPYILKKSGNFNIKLYSKIDFETDLRKLICHDFILNETHRQSEAITAKADIEKIFNTACKSGLIQIKDIESIPYTGTKNPVDKPYVVVIPVVYGYQNEFIHWRSVHALNFSIWEELKRFINKKGYLVVGFGTSHSSTKEDLQKISDICFWYDMYGENTKDVFNVRHINKMTPFQLEWMYFAKTSISLGGAFHIPMTFTVPGIGWDGQVVNNYRHFSGILSNKRSNLFYLPAIEYFPTYFGLENGKDKDHEKIQQVLKNMIFDKLEVIL